MAPDAEQTSSRGGGQAPDKMIPKYDLSYKVILINGGHLGFGGRISEDWL